MEEASPRAPHPPHPVPWLPTLRGPSSSSFSCFPPQPCPDFPAANQLCHPKGGSESWKAGLVQPSSGSWPGDTPRPPKHLLPAFGMKEIPKMREQSNGIAQGLYSSYGDLGKAEDGIPRMQQHFLGGSRQGVIDAPQVGGAVVGAEATGTGDLDALHRSRGPGDWSLCPPAWKIQEGLVRGVSTPPGGCDTPQTHLVLWGPSVSA